MNAGKQFATNLHDALAEKEETQQKNKLHKEKSVLNGSDIKKIFRRSPSTPITKNDKACVKIEYTETEQKKPRQKPRPRSQ